jgi:hypothetical protein
MTKPQVIRDFKFELSLVKSPPCDACSEPMVRFDDWRWICANDACDQNTTPVHVGGVYPFKVIK